MSETGASRDKFCQWRDKIGFRDCNDAQEKDNIIKKNLRAILQLFNIRAYIFPNRIEIQGAIPTQVLDISKQKEPPDVPIIVSPGGHRG